MSVFSKIDRILTNFAIKLSLKEKKGPTFNSVIFFIVAAAIMYKYLGRG